MSSDFETFKALCRRLENITRHNVAHYPEVTLLGRDCYRWGNYVIKSSPGNWNFKTRHELKVLTRLQSSSLIGKFAKLESFCEVNGRTFLLLEYLPYPNFEESFYRHRWQGIKLWFQNLRIIKKEKEIILKRLKDCNLVHRDITPSNLLFDAECKKVFLIDYGFAIEEGQEIETQNEDESRMLWNVVRHNLGGRYREKDKYFSFDSDAYSFGKIDKELTAISRFRSCNF